MGQLAQSKNKRTSTCAFFLSVPWHVLSGIIDSWACIGMVTSLIHLPGCPMPESVARSSEGYVSSGPASQSFAVS